MDDNKKITGMPDMKVRLSALWLFAMLTYTYGDVVTLMDPVKHGSIQLTEGFLLGGSIFMMIPITMVLLSRILKYRANRWTSIIAGTIMTAVFASDTICCSANFVLRIFHSYRNYLYCINCLVCLEVA